MIVLSLNSIFLAHQRLKHAEVRPHEVDLGKELAGNMGTKWLNDSLKSHSGNDPQEAKAKTPDFTQVSTDILSPNYFWICH